MVKSSFFAAVVFFLSFLVFLIVAAFGYYAYFNCLWLAAGAAPAIQPPLLFFEGIFAVWGTCAVFALLPVMVYFIRIGSPSVSGICIWFFLCLIVFGALQPLSFGFKKQFTTFTEAYREKNPLYVEQNNSTIFTSGFFRGMRTGTYYFVDINREQKTASGLMLSVFSGRTSVKPAVIFEQNHAIFEGITHISDPLIAKTITIPGYIAAWITEIVALEAIAEKAFLHSDFPFSPHFWREYSGFFSMSLAFLGFFAFSVFSSWKLPNALALPVCASVILHINFLLQCGNLTPVIKKFLSFLPQILPDELYALVLNAAIFLVLLVAGIIGYATRRAREEIK